MTKDEGLGLHEQNVKTSASLPPEGSWDYSVKVFGTKQYKGCWTAREVPLLLVHFGDVTVPCAAPHEERRQPGGIRGPLRTILDVVRMLDPVEQERLFGAQLRPAGGGR